MSIRRQYPFHLIEPKWQQHWDAQQTFRAWNPGDAIPAEHPFAQRHGLSGPTPADKLPPKCYILDMFPYPSGAGLHVGHPEGYTATDILSRYRRARGFNVLHPMGWDAFGLPAEQYAIKTGQHPRATTEANIANFKRQIQSLGFSYDWTREVDTTDPGYFRWTQWIFLQLYNAWFNPEKINRDGTKGGVQHISELPYPADCTSEEDRRHHRTINRLAYYVDAPVWWCEELGTVLANEEVIDGKSEVGGFPVVRKPMRQWMLRITAYAERLLKDLEHIDWTSSLKEMQRNWIGRSEGADVDFYVPTEESKGGSSSGPVITVFTTRPDTLFGATYVVLAPDHPEITKLLMMNELPSAWPSSTPDAWKAGAASPRLAVEQYRESTSRKSDLERAELAKEKTGVFIGLHACNPVNGRRIPVWIADYVLARYGKGAIMAVPAHDTRDLEFATKFGLPIEQVVQPSDPKLDWRGFCDEGTSLNSASDKVSLTGLATAEAKRVITDWLESTEAGKRTINYRLGDWLFSRQRYWGEPFPLVWKKGDDAWYPEGLQESELPLRLPDLTDFKPTATGEPPLARAKEWVTLSDGATRETNTMPQWAGSCWYYLRYLDARNGAAFCGKEAENYWMGGESIQYSVDSVQSEYRKLNTENSSTTPGVDLYVGGTEHAVLHLLYARFWHKVLFDLGHVSTPEPFFKLVNQGLILGEDGQKMSKSRGNVVNPDDILAEYGADAFRLYEMFMGPLEMVKPWNTKGVDGVYRFLGRVWRLFVDDASETDFEQAATTAAPPTPALLDLIRLKPDIRDAAPTPAQLKTLHTCIKKVTEDLDGLRFNTGISALMVFTNEAMTWEVKPVAVLREFLILLQPFAPHIAEELWDRLNAQRPTSNVQRSENLAYAAWPQHDPALLVEDTLEIPVQVNGKLRDVIRVPAAATPQEIEKAAFECEKVKLDLAGKTVKKVIVVPRKIVNIAAG